MIAEINYFAAFVVISAVTSLGAAAVIWGAGMLRRETPPVVILRRGVVSIGDEPGDLLGLPPIRGSVRDGLDLYNGGGK